MAQNPISIRLDDDVRRILERDAAEAGVGLATYLRNLATERSKALRKAEIYRESRRIGELVAGDSNARSFFDAWGTPSSET